MFVAQPTSTLDWWLQETTRAFDRGEKLPPKTLELLRHYQGQTSPAEGSYLEIPDTYEFTPSPTRKSPRTLTVTDDEWERAEKAYCDERNLRNFCKDSGVVYKDDCGVNWHWYERGDEKALCPYRCNERGRCPRCARVYGEKQGQELESLMKAALARRRLRPGYGEALSWHVVMTYPPEVQAELLRLLKLNNRKALQKVLSELTKLVKRYLVCLFRTHESELGVSVNHHYWHSKDPLDEPFFHMHVIVPNVTRSRRPLYRQGKFGKRRLKEAREVWRDGLTEVFPEVPMPDEVHVWVEFTRNTMEGRAKFSHDCRYATRHALADLLKVSTESPEFFSENNRQRVKSFLNVCDYLHGTFKLRRYLGFLQPGQRKKCGLEREEREGGDERWVKVGGGFRRFLRWSSDGLMMRRWDGHEEVVELVPREQVRLSVPEPPVRWFYENLSEAVSRTRFTNFSRSDSTKQGRSG